MSAAPLILTLNGGSSSIRFTLFEAGLVPRRLQHGKIDRIGMAGPRFAVVDVQGYAQSQAIAAGDFTAATNALLDWLDGRHMLADIAAIGHRIVHGMRHAEPELVSPALIDELRAMTAVDPDHLPGELALIDAFRRRLPTISQVACFDTAFHAGMPRVAHLLALPRRLEAAGVRRYGFHGLSYAYLLEELARVAGAPAAQGRLILAHLGNGSSMAAVRAGASIDTSMGFTPASGLMMGSRAGDIDPGLALFMQGAESMSARAFDAMLNRDSGLRGVSGTSSDMRDLLAAEAADVNAAEAVALYCYQAKKWVGAYAAALGGLDTLVFAGGIGENAAPVRERICAGLDFLGIEIDGARNASSAELISSDAGRVAVRVIRTDEELMIARAVCRLLGFTPNREAAP